MACNCNCENEQQKNDLIDNSLKCQSEAHIVTETEIKTKQIVKKTICGLKDSCASGFRPSLKKPVPLKIALDLQKY